MDVREMVERDWPAVAAIYAEGIATGQATFEAAPSASFEAFSNGALAVSVAEDGGVVGWTRLTRVSTRAVYAGVADVSVYVAAAARGRGVGSTLMAALITGSEAAGVCTLQAGIFPENVASLALHARRGFRVVGRRERIGRMPHGGPWRDTLLLERRG